MHQLLSRVYPLDELTPIAKNLKKGTKPPIEWTNTAVLKVCAYLRDEALKDVLKHDTEEGWEYRIQNNRTKIETLNDLILLLEEIS